MQAAADKSAAIHRRILVLDGHTDVVLPLTPQRYLLPNHGSGTDLPKLIKGGVDAIVVTVAVPAGPRDAAGVAAARREADEELAAIKAFSAANPRRVGIALTADDVERLHREGKVAVLIAFQNARSIGKDISQLETSTGRGCGCSPSTMPDITIFQILPAR